MVASARRNLPAQSLWKEGVGESGIGVM